MEGMTIVIIAVLIIVALLLVWLSLSMAATEGAVARVTRASLNNLILEIQTDSEISPFIRGKKIKRIHKVAATGFRSIRDGRILRVLPYHLQCARRRAGGMHRGDVRCTVVVRAAMRIRLRADRGRDFVAGASA